MFELAMTLLLVGDPEAYPRVLEPEQAAEVITQCLSENDFEQCRWAGYQACSGENTGAYIVGPCEESVGGGWDHLLNYYYNQIREIYGSRESDFWQERSRHLLFAQRAWITLRDNDCELDRWEDGLVHSAIDVATCRHKRTAERANRLRLILSSLQPTVEPSPSAQITASVRNFDNDAQFAELPVFCAVFQLTIDHGHRERWPAENFALSDQFQRFRAYGVRKMTHWMGLASDEQFGALGSVGSNETGFSVYASTSRAITDDPRFNAGAWYQMSVDFASGLIRNRASSGGSAVSNIEIAEQLYDEYFCEMIDQLAQSELP